MAASAGWEEKQNGLPPGAGEQAKNKHATSSREAKVASRFRDLVWGDPSLSFRDRPTTRRRYSKTRNIRHLDPPAEKDRMRLASQRNGAGRRLAQGKATVRLGGGGADIS
jgi:hypothetical protein